MSKIRALKLVASATALAITTTAAIEAHAGETLNDHLVAAERNNPDVKEAAATAALRSAEVDVAWGRVLPAFTARGAYTRNQFAAEVTLPGSSTITITPKNQLEATLTLDVPLIDLAAWKRVTAASSLAEAADARSANAIIDVKKAVARQYYQVVGAHALHDAAVRSTAAAEASLDIVKQRRDAGTGADIDVERAIAEVERMKQSIANARYLEAVASRSLESTSGLASSASSSSPSGIDTDDLHDEAPLAQWERSVDGGGTPAVDAARLEARAFDEQASASRRALLPTLSGVAQERFTNATGFTGRNASWLAGVALTWHVDYGTVSAIKAQDAARDAALAREDRARRAARDRVHDDWQQVASNIAKSRATRTQAAASDHAAKLARDRFTTGRATHLEVIEAERDAFSAEIARIQADADLAYTRIALRLDAGANARNARNSTF